MPLASVNSLVLQPQIVIRGLAARHGRPGSRRDVTFVSPSVTFSHPDGARPALRAKMINIKPPIDARRRTPDRTLMLIISGQRAARAPPADRNAARRSRSAAVVLAGEPQGAPESAYGVALNWHSCVAQTSLILPDRG